MGKIGYKNSKVYPAANKDGEGKGVHGYKCPELDPLYGTILLSHLIYIFLIN